MLSDDELHALLADPSAWEEPSETLEEAVVAAIGREASVATPTPRPPRPAPAPARAPRRIRLVPALAAAAAVLVIVMAAVFALGNGGSGAQFAAELTPTDLAPSAAGHATFTRTVAGWRIEFDASGLPRLDHGRFYQAWLRAADGDLVAIGTFNEGHDVVLWAGVSPAQYLTITVTAESDDKDPASSGRRVLVGTATPR